MQTDPTCRDIADLLIKNYDASAPFRILVRNFTVTDLEFIKDGEGRCLVAVNVSSTEGIQ